MIDTLVLFCVLVDGLCPELVYPARRPSAYALLRDDEATATAVQKITEAYTAASLALDEIDTETSVIDTITDRRMQYEQQVRQWYYD